MRHFLALFIFLLCTVTISAQDFALKQLEESPRHQEWIQINNNGKIIHCFVVYPENSEAADVVISIHENRGLNDWARSFADQLAGKGFLVIAPDLLSSFSDDISKTSDFGSSDEARKGIYQLNKDQVTSDLNAVFDHAKKMEAGTGNVSVAGFCWGGSQTFRYATNNADIKNACVFYGTAPKDKSVLKSIKAPVYGFYGGNDQRVNATIESTEDAMKEYGNTYTYEIYEGAGHAFMRRGDNPDDTSPNKTARDLAWDRLVKILSTSN